MGTSSGHSPRDSKRDCSICGVQYHFSELTLIGDGQYVCPDELPERSRSLLSRMNAQSKVPKPRPFKQAFKVQEIPLYQEPEGRLFNWIKDTAPYFGQDFSTGPQGGAPTAGGQTYALSASEAIRYFYGLVKEAKRPASWLAEAKKQVGRLADWLTQVQFGSPNAPSNYQMFASLTQWGGMQAPTGDPNQQVQNGGTVYASEICQAIYGMSAGYDLFPAKGYLLTQARAAATCLRRMQRGDIRTSNFSTTAAAGSTPRRLGMWVHSFVYGAYTPGAGDVGGGGGGGGPPT